MATEVSARAGTGLAQAFEPSERVLEVGSSPSWAIELVRLLAGTALLAAEGGHA